MQKQFWPFFSVGNFLGNLLRIQKKCTFFVWNFLSYIIWVFVYFVETAVLLVMGAAIYVPSTWMGRLCIYANVYIYKCVCVRGWILRERTRSRFGDLKSLPLSSLRLRRQLKVTFLSLDTHTCRCEHIHAFIEMHLLIQELLTSNLYIYKYLPTSAQQPIREV